jgi:basic membrane protein A
MRRRRITLVGILVAGLCATFTPGAQAARTLSVGVAYDTGGPGDHSYNDAVAAGIVVAKKLYAINVSATVTVGTESDRELRIRSLVKKGCKLVIVVGSEYATPLKIVAKDYPTHQFAIVNDATVNSLNVASLVFAEGQGGYLAGVAAALVSKTARIGVIGYSGQSRDFRTGFVAGARSTRKGIRIQSRYGKQSWGAFATAMIAGGVDVIFLTTPGSDKEVFDAVISANAQGKNVGLIGLEPDQYLTLAASAEKYVLASVVKRADRAVVNVIAKSFAGRSLKDVLDSVAGTYGRRYGIAEGGIEISLWSPTIAKFTHAINAAAIHAGEL